MVAIAAREAHHGRGQQAIELGAAFVCRHAVWMKRVGSGSERRIEFHDPSVPDCSAARDLGRGQAPSACNGLNGSTRRSSCLKGQDVFVMFCTCIN
jgi:hypothetical protein